MHSAPEGLLYSQFSAMHSSYRRNIISVGHHFSPRKQHRGTQKKSHDSSDWRGLACPATINERMNEATQPTTTWWPTTTWCDCFLVHDALIADWSFCCQHPLQAASSFLTSPRTSSKDMLGNLVLNLQSPSLRSTNERRTWRCLEYLRKHFQMGENNSSPKHASAITFCPHCDRGMKCRPYKLSKCKEPQNFQFTVTKSLLSLILYFGRHLLLVKQEKRFPKRHTFFIT